MNEEEILLNYLKDENWEYFHVDGIPYKTIYMQDRDILIKYITQLQNNWNELKKSIKERIKDYEKHLKQGDEPTSKHTVVIEHDRKFLKQMQEMEKRNDRL